MVANAVSGIEGFDAAALAAYVGAPRVVHLRTTGSTMDEAHRLAESGAPSGTVVVADEQTGGRGRQGKKWSSAPGGGLWVTTIHRRIPVSGLDVLSIRIGLGLASALDPFAGATVSVKWPNDLLIGRRKLAGILVEARWRDVAVEWAAVGIGINLTPPPDQDEAAALGPAARRTDLLRAIFPAIAAACSASGDLTPDEMGAWADRDAVLDVPVVEPARGIARGVVANGALIVETAKGRELFRRGSLVRAREPQ